MNEQLNFGNLKLIINTVRFLFLKPQQTFDSLLKNPPTPSQFLYNYLLPLLILPEAVKFILLALRGVSTGTDASYFRLDIFQAMFFILTDYFVILFSLFLAAYLATKLARIIGLDLSLPKLFFAFGLSLTPVLLLSFMSLIELGFIILLLSWAYSFCLLFQALKSLTFSYQMREFALQFFLVLVYFATTSLLSAIFKPFFEFQQVLL